MGMPGSQPMPVPGGPPKTIAEEPNYGEELRKYNHKMRVALRVVDDGGAAAHAMQRMFQARDRGPR